MGLRLSVLQGIAVVFSIVSRKHLKTALEQLKVYSAILTDKDSSSILKLAKVMSFPGGSTSLPYKAFQGIPITPASNFSEAQ